METKNWDACGVPLDPQKLKLDVGSTTWLLFPCRLQSRSRRLAIRHYLSHRNEDLLTWWSAALTRRNFPEASSACRSALLVPSFPHELYIFIPPRIVEGSSFQHRSIPFHVSSPVQPNLSNLGAVSERFMVFLNLSANFVHEWLDFSGKIAGKNTSRFRRCLLANKRRNSCTYSLSAETAWKVARALLRDAVT